MSVVFECGRWLAWGHKGAHRQWQLLSSRGARRWASSREAAIDSTQVLPCADPPLPPRLPLQLPEGAGRLAVFIDGTESDADLAALKVRALRTVCYAVESAGVSSCCPQSSGRGHTDYHTQRVWDCLHRHITLSSPLLCRCHRTWTWLWHC